MSEKAIETKDVRQSILNLSTQDFKNFGLHQIAYIRALHDKDTTTYGVFAADGGTISLTETRNNAIDIARQNNLEMVILH